MRSAKEKALLPEDLPQVHLNMNVSGMARSATLAMNERSAKLKRKGREIIRLGFGQSPFPVPPPVVDELRANVHRKDYLPVKGLPALRSAICEYFTRTENLEFSPENVLVGPGTKELIFLLQLVYHGDLVIPAPSWVSYAPQAHIIGRPVHWLSTDVDTGLGVTPEALEMHCRSDPERPRLLIINYPANPTGGSYSHIELQEIAKVAQRYRILVLSDEIYSGTDFDNNHVSIARYYPDGTIISNGLSKWCSAGGWRLGAFVFPQSLSWLLEAMAVVASETYSSVSAPVQYAAIKAFRFDPAIDEYLKHTRLIMKALMGYTYNALKAVGAELAEPKGGFYVFPNFSCGQKNLGALGINDSVNLCERILEDTGVATLPGVVFGQPETELSARVACVDFDGGKALEVVSETPEGSVPGKAFLETHCQPTVDGVDRLCDWFRRMAA